MPDDQIQNHRGAWVPAEVADALQARVTELTVEIEQLRAQLAATQTAAPVASTAH